MVNLESKKRVFWEALILAVLIFILGFLAGMIFEDKRVKAIEEYYIHSENTMMDVFALNNYANIGDLSCESLINSNINFANRIYEEAKILDVYEGAGRLTENLKAHHKKYDIMRTLLWINTLRISEVCDDEVNVVIYAYERYPEDLTKKALNNVWSKILGDLKKEHGNNIILIPVAVDMEISSLNLLLENFDIDRYPVLIVNNKDVINKLVSVRDIEDYFY